jgi:2,3-dihydroxyphenylpropionate 1,2-dioxygenase
MNTPAQKKISTVYAACVPHVPFLEIQQRELNAPFWAAYEAQAARLRAFDPELVFVFGADHYEGQLLRAMSPFMVGLGAEAVPDRGGFPGELQVPEALARSLAEFLVDRDFDVATSYAMQVDHGFSQVLHHMLGGVGVRLTIPLFVNSLAHPRPKLARVRRLGAAVGEYAATLGKRVAILGSGGLSHETGDIFPQAHETSNLEFREFMIHGGSRGSLTREKWRQQLHDGLAFVNQLHEARTPGVGQVRPEWDARFLKLLAEGDLTVFDNWSDADLLRDGGNGAGEVRLWIAAMAAAQAMGAGSPVIDYCEAGTCIGVEAVVAHAESPAAA